MLVIWENLAKFRYFRDSAEPHMKVNVSQLPASGETSALISTVFL